MKTLKKLTFLFLLTGFISACSSNKKSKDSMCNNTCEHTLGSGETASTIATSLEATYNLTFDFAQTGAPFTDGTKASFTIINNRMIVEIAGEDCITLKNPFRTSGGVQDIFTDDCSKNIQYHISTKQDGSFNEINIFGFNENWLGQFHN